MDIYSIVLYKHIYEYAFVGYVLSYRSSAALTSRIICLMHGVFPYHVRCLVWLPPFALICVRTYYIRG